jgi:alkaline phosphatase D
MAAEGADLAVFVGDNSYFIAGTGGEGHFGTTGPRGDWSFPESMMARHLATRTHPDLQALFRSTPCYAVWDDHDYGPNNADAHFPLREEAAAMFRRAWANPAYGTAEVPGIFSAFRFGPVEIFLMDDRYHKHSPQVHGDVSPETGRIWGEGQLAWLMRGLRASTAPVKCIANGTQILARDDRGEGHFQEAQGELRQLLEVLEEARIGGVIFLTGDRHYTEVNRQEQPGGALLVEFTSSPLQQGQEIGPLERRQANQVWGMSGNSYGLVTVDIPREGEGTVRFEARDAGNRAPVIAGRECVSTWNLADLQY